MRNNDKLQVPLDKKLKQDFKKKCESMGFSSVNEAMRVLVHNFTYSNMILQLMNQSTPHIDSYVEILDDNTANNLTQSYEDIKKGDVSAINLKDPQWFEKLIDVK